MDARERYAMLSTGRSGEFRNFVREFTNDPRDFPTKSATRAALAELFPGDEYAEAREGIYGKLVQIAQARAGGMDLVDLRGLVDEYVIKVETELTKDDSFLPTEDAEPVDTAAALEVIDAWDTSRRTSAQIAAEKAADIASAQKLGGS